MSKVAIDFGDSLL